MGLNGLLDGKVRLGRRWDDAVAYHKFDRGNIIVHVSRWLDVYRSFPIAIDLLIT